MHNKKIIIFFIFIFVYFESVFSQETRLFSILKKKEIVVSVAKTYEPFYIEDPNEGFPGFDVDFAKKYAKFLDVNIKIIPLGDFEDQARAIVSGKVDIAVAGISSHLARAKEVNFSDPYLITTPAGLVNKQSLPPEPEGQIVVVKPFKDLLDLKFQSGISFSVKSDSSSYFFLKKNFENSKTYSYLSNNLSLDSLLRNNVNCFVADGLLIEALLQKKPELKANYLPLLNPVSEEHISVALPKNDVYLTQSMNFFIKEMKRNGNIKELKAKYFNNNGWVKKN